MTNTFRPANEKQKGFIESKKRYLLLSGAVGAGKSFLLCWKGFILNLAFPGNRGLICRKEARSLQNTTIQTLLNQVIPQSYIVSYNEQRGVLVHRTLDPKVNSTIVFAGLDKKAAQTYPTKIGSSEYGWIGVDEGTELIEGDWMMLTTRLRHKTGHPNQVFQMFTATNPDAPTHWMHKFFFESDNKDRDVFLTTPYDNPYLPEDYIKSLETTLTGISRERLLLGKWVQAEGIIYNGFSRERHIIEPDKLLPIKDYKMLFFGGDSNYPLPRAFVLVGVKENGQIDIIDEFYKPSSFIEEARDWLLEWQKKKEWTLCGVIDPSAPSDIEKLNSTPGLKCDKANNAVLQGISEVSRYFDNNLISINRNCSNLIRELQSYRWKKGADKEVPDKVDDHLVDGLRYCLMSMGTPIQPFVMGMNIFGR